MRKFLRIFFGPWALTRTLQICRFFSPSFGGRMASAFSLVKSRSLYLVIGPMWQKFILLTIPHYSKIDWPLTLFCTRSPPFMSSDVIFLQAKWSKIKERVKGWKSGKKTWFKRITVCICICWMAFLIILDFFVLNFLVLAHAYWTDGRTFLCEVLVSTFSSFMHAPAKGYFNFQTGVNKEWLSLKGLL